MYFNDKLKCNKHFWQEKVKLYANTCRVSLGLECECGATCWLNVFLQLILNISVWGWTQRNTYLGRGLKGGVHRNLWHIPVVDVLVAVPHAVD